MQRPHHCDHRRTHGIVGPSAHMVKQDTLTWDPTPQHPAMPIGSPGCLPHSLTPNRDTAAPRATSESQEALGDGTEARGSGTWPSPCPCNETLTPFTLDLEISRDRATPTFSKAAKSTWAWPVTSTTVEEKDRQLGPQFPQTLPPHEPSQHQASCPHLSSHSMNYTTNPSSHKAPFAVREGLTIALIHHSLDDHWEHTPVQVKVQLRRKDQSGGQEGSRTDGTTALPLLGRDMNLPFKCSQGAMLQPRAPRKPAIHCLSMTPSPTPCEYTYTLAPSVSEPPSPTVMAGICTLAGPTFPITTNREGTKSQSCVQPL